MSSPVAEELTVATTSGELRSALKRSSSSPPVYIPRSVPGSSSDLATPVGTTTALARHRRRRIRRAILSIVALVGILLAVLALLISKPRTARIVQGLCSSPSCQLYIRSLNASLDNRLDPCEDFYAFVCSRWTPDSGGRSFLEDAKLSFENSVLEQASSIKSPTVGQARFQKAIMFYRSCITSTDNGVSYLVNFLRASGIPWPAIDKRRDPLDVILRLSFQWQCPVFLYAYMGPLARGGKGLQLLDSFMGATLDAFLEEHHSRRDNIGLVCELYDSLSTEMHLVEHENQSSGTARPCERMAQQQSTLITQLEAGSDGTWATYSSVYEFASNMTPTIDGHKWVRILLRHTPRGEPVRSSTPVDISDPGYLKALITILARKSKEESLLFIGLTAVQVVGRFISSQVAALLYSSERHGAEKGHALVCYRMTEFALPGALSNPLPTYLFEEHRILKATQVAKVITESSKMRLRSSAWLGAKSKYVVTKKIANAEIIFDGKEREAVTKHAELLNMTNSFVKNVQNLPYDYWARFRRRSKSNTKADAWINPWHQTNVTAEFNKLTIPDVYMLKRVFPDNAYESIYYATIGSLVAREISTAHDLTGRKVDSNGTEIHWLSAEEEAKQDAEIECLVRAFKRQYNGSAVTTAEKSALYVAWNSLSPLLDGLQQSPGFPEWSTGFQHYTPLQLFFISLCFNMCARYDTDRTNLFTEESWCNFPLSLFKPFHESFHCAENSHMNPGVSCNFDSL